MYIEELIQFVTSSGQYLFNAFPTNVIGLNDYKILESIATRLYYNQDRLTEKQAILVVKLLKKNRDVIRPHLPSIDQLLENPQWQHPFRVIPTIKKISIDGAHILVEFPYEQDLVEALRGRNQDVHPIHAGAWDHEVRKWKFQLTETNIEWLGNFLLTKGFDADEKFQQLYAEVIDVIHNIENRLPMIVPTSSGFAIKNAHPKVPQPETNNLAEVLFWARDYGITTWDDSIGSRIKSELHPITYKILSAGVKRPWVNSLENGIEGFADALKYGGPVLIVIPGGSELESVVKWATFAASLGIKEENMSVMFRLPNEQADFNTYVRDSNLNNPVDENTKIVFVSTKITKPLVKSGIRFKTVINLGYYNYLHFSMSAEVDNAQNLVYYSMKEPNKYNTNKWQQHEL